MNEPGKEGGRHEEGVKKDGGGLHPDRNAHRGPARWGPGGRGGPALLRLREGFQDGGRQGIGWCDVDCMAGCGFPKLWCCSTDNWGVSENWPNRYGGH